MEKSIMPECYTDTLLIETLVPARVGYNHKMGCFNVEAEMTKGKFKDEFAVGIIDKDKNQVEYLEEFEEIDSVPGSLILWKHRAKNHFIIQLCPALEKWVLNICKKENIDLSEFGLEADLEKLKRHTKKQTSLKDKQLNGLFRIMGGKKECEAIRKLKNWVTILKEKNYQVDINELKNA